jgi:hypothetical protein
MRCPLEVVLVRDIEYERQRAFKILLMIPVLLLIMLILSLVILVCPLLFGYRHALFPHPRQGELKAAYERFLKTKREASLTLDTSRLSEVVTGELLESYVSSIEAKKEKLETGDVLTTWEFEIFGFWVLDYSPPTATAGSCVKYSSTFTQDPETGEWDYGSDPYSWQCNEYEVRLVQEDGVWKVQEENFIEWASCDAPENWTPPARAAPTVQTKGFPLPE